MLQMHRVLKLYISNIIFFSSVFKQLFSALCHSAVACNAILSRVLRPSPLSPLRRSLRFVAFLQVVHVRVIKAAKFPLY